MQLTLLLLSANMEIFLQKSLEFHNNVWEKKTFIIIYPTLSVQFSLHVEVQVSVIE